MACARPLRGERAYYLISPQALSPVLAAFSAWLATMAALAHRGLFYKRPFGSKVSSLQIDGQQKGQMACTEYRQCADARQGPLHHRGC